SLVIPHLLKPLSQMLHSLRLYIHVDFFGGLSMDFETLLHAAQFEIGLSETSRDLMTTISTMIHLKHLTIDFARFNMCFTGTTLDMSILSRASNLQEFNLNIRYPLTVLTDSLADAAQHNPALQIVRLNLPLSHPAEFIEHLGSDFVS